MSQEFIFSPLAQFEVLSLIGFNAPILNYFNLSLTNLGFYTILVFCSTIIFYSLGFALVRINYIYLIDILLIIFVVFSFINDFFNCYSLIVDKIYDIINLKDVMCFFHTESESTNNASSSTNNVIHTTNTTIIHNDGSWNNAIRSLFIYGSGSYRLYLTRGGTPGSRFVITGSTIIADSLSRIITNAINDPEYISNHFKSWRIFRNGSNANVTVDKGGSIDRTISQVQTQAQAVQEANQAASQTASQNSGSNLSNKFISGDNGWDDITNNLLNNLMDYIKPILEPVEINYSNELLANQIYGLSIMLFILSVLIIVLLLFFIINIVIFTYSDTIKNYFSNKYIKWYININKKFIGVEIILLGSSLLYFMFILSYGIRFIATHPIIIS